MNTPTNTVNDIETKSTWETPELMEFDINSETQNNPSTFLNSDGVKFS